MAAESRRKERSTVYGALMLVLGLLVIAATQRAGATSLPPASQAIVGNVRVQALSPTLVRVEESGPHFWEARMGWEDRETFTVVGRANFSGVPITATKVLPSGATQLTTAHYLVQVKSGDAAADGSAAAAPTELPLKGEADFRFSGGASVTTSPKLSLRSGTPHSTSTAAVNVALSPGAVVDSVSFSYQYCTGYSTSGAGTNFTLSVAGATAYTSPVLADYPYKKTGDPFSPAVMVSAAKLGIKVPSSGISPIAFEFQNSAMNLQLELPMTITLTCAGGKRCVAPPNEVAVLTLNGTTLANITSFGSVPGTLSFPLPSVDFAAANPSWAIKDSPRYIPAAGGVVPPTAAACDRCVHSTPSRVLREAREGEYMKVVYFWYRAPNRHWANVQVRACVFRARFWTIGSSQRGAWSACKNSDGRAVSPRSGGFSMIQWHPTSEAAARMTQVRMVTLLERSSSFACLPASGMPAGCFLVRTGCGPAPSSGDFGLKKREIEKVEHGGAAMMA